jgi:AcrR family transcriptional regulator
MVEAAERLIAQRGLAAVSLRDVQVEAGQRNKSAANYHFGSREGLIDAVVEARMAPIEERRRAVLAEIDAAGRGNEVRALVEALIVPLAEATVALPESSYYARFLGQLVADPTTVALTRKHLWAPSFRSAYQRLVDLLDDVPAPLRQGRVDRIIGLAIFALAAWEGGWVDDGIPHEARVPDLVDSCVAIAVAPSSPGARQAAEMAGDAGLPDPPWAWDAAMATSEESK